MVSNANRQGLVGQVSLQGSAISHVPPSGVPHGTVTGVGEGAGVGTGVGAGGRGAGGVGTGGVGTGGVGVGSGAQEAINAVEPALACVPPPMLEW